MKKLIILSFFIVSSAVMTSCTADSIADTTPSTTINADDPGGQGIPPPPPPPKPPGTGTGKMGSSRIKV
ncbi:MAG: hypothetical protein M0D53_01160 [Flavobacterium sp. JAD_PAG50586_2]|nr:MAG: hypothetical protein M0D53_01160 [Flavobacterium sp. JAD_PAG50586_2]